MKEIPEIAEEPRPLGQTLLLLVLVLLLFALGIIILIGGWDAIRREHFELEWSSRAPGHSARGVMIFDGADAICEGLGLMALGAMLATWGLMVVALLAGQSMKRRTEKLLRTLGWLSLGLLLSAAGCLCPPWTVRSVCFFSVLMLTVGSVFFVSGPHQKKWLRRLLPGTVICSIVAGYFHEGAATGIVLGFFAAIVLLIHLFALFPKFMKRAVPE